MTEPAEPDVALVALAPGHADALFEAFADSELYRYLDDDPPPSLDWLRRRFAALAAGAPPDSGEQWCNWAIIGPDGSVVGTTQATVRDEGPTSVAYVLAADVHGRGIGRAAVRLMLDVLAAEYGVVDAQAEIDPRNARSIRLVESLGFVDAGTIGSDRRFVRRLSR